MNGVKILGTGSYFPDRILTNKDLEKIVDTTDEWITQRTGIKERRIADDKTATSDLAVSAIKNAIIDAGISKEEIDMIIVATATPDRLFPSTACFVQAKLGIKETICFDISAACSGFIYALVCAWNLLRCGNIKTAVVVGAETLSRITDWQDRSTCVLFGDGAGAMILRAKNEGEEDDIISACICSDGNYDEILYMSAGGARFPASRETVEKRMHYLKMSGREVFRIAIVKMVEVTLRALELAGKKIDDIKLLIPHQANIRIIDTMAEKLNFPKEKIFVNLHKYGNVSAATTITALDEARKKGIVKSGDLVEIVAFGGGLTWGAVVLRV